MAESAASLARFDAGIVNLRLARGIVNKVRLRRSMEKIPS